MTFSLTTTWALQPLSPFGLLARTNQGADIYAVPTAVLLTWVTEHRFLVLRGFEPLLGDALPEFCETLGELLAGDLGPVRQPYDRGNARGNRDTHSEVPLHWAGAFTDRSPHYLFYHCDEAPPPGAGGQTFFCDTIRLLDRAPPEDVALWRELQVTYTTEQISPPLTAVTGPLLSRHPLSRERTLRFAEPFQGPLSVRLQVSGIIEEAQEAFVQEMRERLHDPAVGYTHTWQTGDIVIADNHALLHGRHACRLDAPRKIRRVDVLCPAGHPGSGEARVSSPPPSSG